VKVYGHRGSRRPGPENTVTAVAAALAAGADGVEVDVRRSRDDRLVCVHDASVRRRAVRALTAAELQEFGVPGVPDVLDCARGRGRVVLEVKNRPGEAGFDAPREATALALVRLLQTRPPGDDLLVSSFDWFAVEVVQASGLGIPTAFTSAPGVSLTGAVSYAVGAGHAEVHAHRSAVVGRADGVRRAHDAGLRLVVWTVTSLRQAERLRDVGVDGVICDDPATVLAGLNRG
jgi:glycerophosphoryl diester phosphodiesterase